MPFSTCTYRSLFIENKSIYKEIARDTVPPRFFHPSTPSDYRRMRYRRPLREQGEEGGPQRG